MHRTGQNLVVLRVAGWPGGRVAGWLDQMEIMQTQLQLKLKLKLSLAINKQKNMIIPADKTSKYYLVPAPKYKKLLEKETQKDYKRVRNSIFYSNQNLLH